MIESRMPETQQLHVDVRSEDGSMWATVEEFPGVFATGEDFDELRESLEEGIALTLAEAGREPPRVRLAALRAEPYASKPGPNLSTLERQTLRACRWTLS